MRTNEYYCMSFPFYFDKIKNMCKNKKVLTRDLFPKERVFEIDLLCFFPILLVMLFHLMYDFTMLPSLFSNYDEIILRYPTFKILSIWCSDVAFSTYMHDYLVPFFAGVFLFICGVSTSFSKNNTRRSLLLLFMSFLISLGSYLLSYLLQTDLFILFGILHIMGLSIFLYSLLELFARKVLKKDVGPLVCFLIGIPIFITGLVMFHGITIDGQLIRWPIKIVGGFPQDMIQENPWNIFYSIIGVVANPTDWWPIFPYLGLIFIGIAVGKILYPQKKTLFPKVNTKYLKPMLFLGRHTIWVYILHQPIFIIILASILLPMGFRL